MSVSGRSRSRVAIIGAGPGGLVLATALARRGNSEVTVYDRAEDHKVAPRFNPDRSYTIDITGHGLNALRYIDAVERFDKDLIKFSGVRVLAPGLKADYPWKLPGWTGSRGDICRALQSNCEVRRGAVRRPWIPLSRALRQRSALPSTHRRNIPGRSPMCGIRLPRSSTSRKGR